jgi:hypothetical protein
MAGAGVIGTVHLVQPMHSDSTPDKIYEITFPDGRTERRRKIGLAEQAAIATAIQFGERLVVTISPEPPGGERKDIEPSANLPQPEAADLLKLSEGS